MSLWVTRVLGGAVQKAQDYAELVKFSHTVFAMPFALSAFFLALHRHGGSGWALLWVVMAMVGARTCGMAINRLADARLDALNPRTLQRGLPAGRVKPWEAALLAIFGTALLVVGASQLPLLCLQLLPVALLLVVGYSYSKRVTPGCHLILGLTLGAGVVGGWLAVTGAWSGLALLFGASVACWVAGFDILYACQDVAFDRAQRLHSIPAWVGVPKAMAFSRYLHGLALLGWLGFGLLYGLGVGYWLGWLAMLLLLWRQHRIVSPEDLQRINEAFFVLNGWGSVAMLAGVLWDVWFVFA
jgi:4-hydroxybenzoate polyprenyltransferase